MEIFYLQYEASPTIESDIYNDVGGAYINCWIKTDSLQSAMKIAEKDIKNNRWVVHNLEDLGSVTNDNYDEDDNALEYYQQALMDGEVYVYHSWPNEQQDGEVH